VETLPPSDCVACFSLYNHHGKRLLTPIGGKEWNNDLKRLLGQVRKLRSATIPKLASWNVHEQSFVVGRVLEINQHLFEGPRCTPGQTLPYSQGVRHTTFETVTFGTMEKTGGRACHEYIEDYFNRFF